jgi:hypothetical protein
MFLGSGKGGGADSGAPKEEDTDFETVSDDDIPF